MEVKVRQLFGPSLPIYTISVKRHKRDSMTGEQVQTRLH